MGQKISRWLRFHDSVLIQKKVKEHGHVPVPENGKGFVSVWIGRMDGGIKANYDTSSSSRSHHIAHSVGD